MNSDSWLVVCLIIHGNCDVKVDSRCFIVQVNCVMWLAVCLLVQVNDGVWLVECLPSDNVFVVQVNCDVGVDTKHQTVQGVAFPLSQAAIGELQRLKAGKVTYVQLVCIRCCIIWTSVLWNNCNVYSLYYPCNHQLKHIWSVNLVEE